VVGRETAEFRLCGAKSVPELSGEKRPFSIGLRDYRLAIWTIVTTV
jgi:hypothetical protein